jgi:hypothetical protein
MVATPQNKRKKLIKKLKSRFRLTVLNENTFEEKLSYSLTPLNLIIMFGGMLIVFGTLIYLLVAFTPLKNYVIPDYAATEFREEARRAPGPHQPLHANQLRPQQYQLLVQQSTNANAIPASPVREARVYPARLESTRIL